jgi:multidrug efflux pump
VFLPRISIERPVLATVFSLTLVVFGITGYSRLPVRELPNVEFPVVSVVTVLPGASPEVVETEVTEVLEEQLNGIEGLDSLRSTSSEQVSRITLQFDLARDIDAAAQDVRDRVGRVLNRLPEDVDQPRVRKIDADAQAIMWIALYSDSRERMELIDVADNVIRPRLETVPGVGQIMVGGSNRRAMRVEVNRNALAAYDVTVTEILRAAQDENVEVPSGRIEGTWREFVVKTEGEYSTPEGFRSLIVAHRDGQPIRLGDLAEVRHGYENERTMARFNGVPTTGLGIVKQSRANTLDVAKGVKQAVLDLKQELPDGFKLKVAFDQSGFIEQSVAEVQQSLIIAGVLVVIIIFVFLQSVRSTLIPSIVIPVALISTFGVMYFLNFTINNLTLMALTLVVGVVVDDAIIVLENVYRHMEAGETRREAALKASEEIAFAVIATTLTLVAVFVPIAFLSGIVGRFFFEFGISVSIAVCASSFVALTLTPMLCSRFLQLGTTATKKGIFGTAARAFDRWLERLAELYVRALGWTLRHRAVMVVVLVIAVIASASMISAVGKEFVPDDDRGYFIASIKTPEGSSLAYHDFYQKKVETLLEETAEIRSFFSIVALSSGGPGSVNSGIMFVRLVDPNERDLTTQEVVTKMRRGAGAIVGADAYFFISNPLRGDSRGKPLQFVVQHPDFPALAESSGRLLEAARDIPGLTGVDTDLELNKPQISVTIDRDKAALLGISALDIADTLRILFGGDTITRFKRGNELYDVILQLEAADRFAPADLARVYTRTGAGDLVPMANIVNIRETVGPSEVNHYDRKRSVVIDANLDGIDLGTALDALSAKAAEILPPGFTTTLAGESREFSRGSQGLAFTFLLAIAAIYLVLAAQFESFIHPLTIMLALPLATLGALGGLLAFDMTLNVYSFIGLIMLMGLVTKNSILLVDYTNLLRARGIDVGEALLEAGRTRLRPILMTAVSTIFGILPIALGLGAGSESRRPLGVAVVAGMLVSTLLTLLVVPVVYQMFDDAIVRMRGRRSPDTAKAKAVSAS